MSDVFCSEKINIEFYRINILYPKDGRMEEFFNKSIQNPPGSRNVSSESQYVRLQEGSAHGQFWSGDMLRIRMEELPVKAALSRTVESLDLT